MDQMHIEEKIFLSFLRALRVLRGKMRMAERQDFCLVKLFQGVSGSV